MVSLATDTLVGAATGFLGAAAGPLLGAAVRGIASSGAGAAVVNTVRTAIKSVTSKVASVRPQPAAMRPAAGAKPAGGNSPGATCSLRNSFVPATAVLMADGSTKPIEAIQVGDLVWASDPVTGEAGARAVSATITGDGQKHLVTITTGDGAVVATDGHPFWNPDDQVWETAGDLQPGDTLQGADGVTSIVTSVEEIDAVATVHNFSVTDFHTYYVLIGETPTLVHNCGDTAGPLSKVEFDGLQKAVDPNKLNHLFSKQQHGLDDLVERFGSQEGVVEQMYRGLAAEVPSQGLFSVTRSVGGQAVTIDGAVVDGIARIGTAYIRP